MESHGSSLPRDRFAPRDVTCMDASSHSRSIGRTDTRIRSRLGGAGPSCPLGGARLSCPMKHDGLSNRIQRTRQAGPSERRTRQASPSEGKSGGACLSRPPRRNGSSNQTQRPRQAGPSVRQIKLRLAFREDRLVAIVPGLVRAEHANSRCIVQRTHVFADTAANALFGIHARLLDQQLSTVAKLDFHRHTIDGFVRNRAMLFTNDTIAPIDIGNATCRIERRQSDFDLVLFFLQQRPNGLRRADMPAQRTRVITVTNQRHEMGSKNPLQASLCNCRLKPPRRANLHTHSTCSAPSEEFRFRTCSRRANQSGMIDRGSALRRRSKQGKAR